jgi:hypothetical protein
MKLNYVLCALEHTQTFTNINYANVYVAKQFAEIIQKLSVYKAMPFYAWIVLRSQIYSKA